MKKLMFVIAFITALCVSNVSNANTIVLTQNSYSYSNGGEFTATTSQNGTFETFCVETSVEFTPGRTYSYTISDVDSNGRSLAQGTAFLYHEFITGDLVGYDYNGASRYVDAGLLQSAIWYFQGQASMPSGDPYYALAVSVLGNSAFDADNGQYGVGILQLWDGKTPAQNQLVSVPDKTNTAYLLLIGLGLVLMPKSKLLPE